MRNENNIQYFAAVFYSCYLTGVVFHLSVLMGMLVCIQLKCCIVLLSWTVLSQPIKTSLSQSPWQQPLAPPLAYLASCLKWAKSVPAGHRWYNRMMNDQVNRSIIVLFTVHLSGTAWFLWVLFHGMLDSYGVLTTAAPCVNQTALLTLHTEQMEREQNTYCTALHQPWKHISLMLISTNTGFHPITEIQECKQIFRLVWIEKFKNHSLKNPILVNHYMIFTW